ncbi:hypothetical protein MXD62_00830 [Frankia sp. Mgl5]|uniref:hypothetical protein n=1 Tax=Frankia sp. Mgl5 TaxID=2933793 RepID=UPI00200C7B38|nr:hypothetical protein [Frankia sp. Mgl5]MCK9925723.1 hypothetical protein [Frankia sp. Mgl5]
MQADRASVAAGVVILPGLYLAWSAYQDLAGDTEVLRPADSSVERPERPGRFLPVLF